MHRRLLIFIASSATYALKPAILYLGEVTILLLVLAVVGCGSPDLSNTNVSAPSITPAEEIVQVAHRTRDSVRAEGKTKRQQPWPDSPEFHRTKVMLVLRLVKSVMLKNSQAGTAPITVL